MKKTIIITFALLLISNGCVEDPNVTEEKYLQTPNPTNSWVIGVKRQMALTMNKIVPNMELVSDNYFNNYTLFSKVFDIPQIDYYDLDVERIQQQIHRLRVMAEYGLEKVVPADPSATNRDKAYLLFARAYTGVLMGELFVGLPDEEKGKVIPSEIHFKKAIDFINKAEKIEPSNEMKEAYNLLKARIYYNLGEIDKSMEFAQKTIELNPNLLYQVSFDSRNKVPNDMQTALFNNPQNLFTPSPRLDFLDPKFFYKSNPLEQSPISIIKSEEAYLIIIEGYIHQKNLNKAKETFKELFKLIESRPVVSVLDNKDDRTGTERNDFPKTPVGVRFSENAPLVSGLILDRKNAPINVPVVSGTHISMTEVNQANTPDELLYLTYLVRQEVFISEGRRATDLGIKLPVSKNEADNNPNIASLYLKAQIPSFIPLSKGMDDYAIDNDGNVVMKYDMNRVLVENKTSPLIAPFFN